MLPRLYTLVVRPKSGVRNGHTSSPGKLLPKCLSGNVSTFGPSPRVWAPLLWKTFNQTFIRQRFNVWALTKGLGPLDGAF